jgi:DNA-binding CsgD family transcriptional regulator/PAS domain-containing protein
MAQCRHPFDVEMFDVLRMLPMSTPDLIYEAALYPEGWQTALSALARDTGARDVAIGAYNAATMVHETINLPIDPYYERQYETHWASRNFLWERTAKLPVGELFSFETVLPATEFARTAFYNEWWHPQGLDRAMGMNLIVDNEVSAVITIYRPDSRPEFSNRDKALFAGLLPHLVRALEIRRRVTHAASIGNDFRETLAQLNQAGFIVAATGQLLHCNRIAERLLAEKAFRLSGSGVLTAENGEATSILHQLVKNATGRTGHSKRAFLSRFGKRALMTRVYPLFGIKSAFSSPRALILVDDPESAPAVTEGANLLRVEFKLTAAEATLAIQLASGEDLKGYAERTGVAYATVRTHLARIFDKMGLQRQSELCRLVVKLGLDG